MVDGGPVDDETLAAGSEEAAQWQAASSGASSEVLLGQEIGAYKLISVLGRGGMGTVYKAEHRALQRPVAIKMMLGQCAEAGEAEDQEFIERFLREGRLAASVEHANLVTVHDCGRWQGRPYLVLEYVDGGDINELLKKRGQFSEEQALKIIIQAAKGLEALEAKGLVHRDIKPGNIFLNSDGIIKIGDMGLARLRYDTEDLTVTGQVIGTPVYMAPEQVLGQKDIDSRIDIYALGATLFTLLTGVRPYDGATPFAIVDLVLNGALPSLHAYRSDLSLATSDLVMRAMAKDRADRFAHVGEFIDALRACLKAAQDAGSTGPTTAQIAETVQADVLQSSPLPTNRRAPRKQRRSAAPAKSAAPVLLVGGLLIIAAVFVTLLMVMPRDHAEVEHALAQGDPVPTAPPAQLDERQALALGETVLAVPTDTSLVTEGDSAVEAPVFPAQQATEEMPQPAHIAQPVTWTGKRIHVLGHSFASGVGSDYLPAIQLLDGRFQHLSSDGRLSASGFPGASSETILQAMYTGLVPDTAYEGVLVLWAARNSLLAEYEATKNHIEKMQAYAERRGCKHYLITECPLLQREIVGTELTADGEKVHAFNQWLAQRFGKERIIAAEQLLIEYPSNLEADHPSTEAYLLWARRLARKICAAQWVDTALPTQRSQRSVATKNPDDILLLRPYPDSTTHLPQRPELDHTACVWYRGSGSGFLLGCNQVSDSKARWGIRIFKKKLWLGMGSAFGVYEASSPADDKWHLLGWRVKDGRAQIIYDGVLDKTFKQVTDYAPGQSWCIGGADPMKSGRWSANGAYSQCVIWHTALSAKQIAALYNKGQGLAPAQLPAQETLAVLLPLDAHRGRFDYGWPDLLGHACAQAITLGEKQLIDDAPGFQAE